MAKTLKDFLEGYLKVKSADEQKFIDKHVTAKNPDRNGNGDDVFKGSTKPIDRRKERKGYNPGEDEKVYEAVETERVKHPVGQRPKGPGWVLKQAGEQTGKDHNVWERKFKRVNEALKGDQHKIDANHNGKIDAEDFKKLRSKGKWASKSYKTADGRWASKDVKEDAEQIDELSKATVGSYAQKAKDDLSRSDYLAGKKMGERMHGAKPDNAERKLNAKASKRYKGLGMAINKLAKEEVEELEELSTEKLLAYRKKAREADTNKHHVYADEADKKIKKKTGVYNPNLLQRAKAKLRNEEAEELDEKLSAKAPMGSYIKDFEKSDAPQFKGKSPAKRRVMAIAAKLSAERGGKPLNKEERLQARLGDISESHQRVMLEVFEKLNEDNKSKFLQACDTPDGVDQMLDFAINNRGE